MATPSPEGKDNQEKKRKGQANSYMRYTGMAFQMGATIFVGILLGQFLDRKMQTSRPYFTMLFAIVFTGAAVYLTIKDFLKNDQ